MNSRVALGLFVSSFVLPGVLSGCGSDSPSGSPPTTGTDAGVSSGGGAGASNSGGSSGKGGNSAGGANSGGTPGSGGASSGGAENGGAGSGGDTGSGGAGSGGDQGAGGAGGTGTGGDVGAGGGIVDAGLGTGGAAAGGAPTAEAGVDASDAGPQCGVCASGVCVADSECGSCIEDGECASNHFCSSGTCLPACSNDGVCPTDFTCCGARCADTTRDRQACGDCDTQCQNDEFCGRSGCLRASLSAVCDTAKATVFLDGLAADESAATVIHDALGDDCVVPPDARLVTASASGTLNTASGRPVVGSGDIQVVVGGTFGQIVARYMEAQPFVPVYNTYDATTAQFRVRNPDGGNTAIVDIDQTTQVTPSHDWFVVEVAVEPTSGTPVLLAYGFGAHGTAAAAWYFANTMLPSIGNYPDAYYIYEWTDGDSDQLPTAGDTFTLVASGS